MSKRIHLVATARPNFMKIAPLYPALVKEGWAEPKIIHTGQHYDTNMSDAFFRDLELPERSTAAPWLLPPAQLICNAYRDQNWSWAILNLNHLNKRYPEGRY